MIDTTIQSTLATDGAAAAKAGAQPDPQETREWLDALDGVIDAEGAGRASELVRAITMLLLLAAGIWWIDKTTHLLT